MNRRLLLIATVSLTATGLVIGSALRGHDTSALTAYALARAEAARAVPHAAATTTETTPTPQPSPTPAETDDATSPASGTPTPEPASPAPTPDTRHPTPKEKPTPTTASKIRHVFVITLSSPGYDATFGPTSPATYLNQELRPNGRLLTDYYAVGHGDLPNYIAMVSGQPPNYATGFGCTSYSDFATGAEPDPKSGIVPGNGCVYPVDTLTLADQLGGKGKSWRAYLQGMDAPGQPATCRHPDPGAADDTQQGRPGDEYAARHNPFVYFHSLLDLGDCATNDVGLDKLSADLASAAKTPDYSFIAPDLCHDGSEPTCADGSSGGLPAADAFLAQWVPQILASPAYRKDGLLMITFGDGPASDSSGCCGQTVGGGKTGTLLLSRYLKAGTSDATSYNAYSLLRTVEDVFGVSHLAEAAGRHVHPFGGGLVSGSGI